MATIAAIEPTVVSNAYYSSPVLDNKQELSVNIQHLSGVPDAKINPKGMGEFMNIFSTLPQYAGKWSVKSSRKFTDEEIASVRKAVVVSSNYGNSVCFFMVSGNQTFIPLSQNSSKGVGETVDLHMANLLTLEKEGEGDILRVEI